MASNERPDGAPRRSQGWRGMYTGEPETQTGAQQGAAGGQAEAQAASAGQAAGGRGARRGGLVAGLAVGAAVLAITVGLVMGLSGGEGGVTKKGEESAPAASLSSFACCSSSVGGVASAPSVSPV